MVKIRKKEKSDLMAEIITRIYCTRLMISKKGPMKNKADKADRDYFRKLILNCSCEADLIMEVADDYDLSDFTCTVHPEE